MVQLCWLKLCVHSVFAQEGRMEREGNLLSVKHHNPFVSIPQKHSCSSQVFPI